MSNNFIERLQYFMDKEGINDNQMTIAAGLSVGLLGKLKKSGKGMSSVNIEKILSSYPQLNANWLLTGRGSMLVNEAAEGAEEQAEGATSTPTDTQYTQMMNKMLEMAQEIGRLKEQIRQSNIQKDIHAAHANTTPIADAG